MSDWRAGVAVRPFPVPAGTMLGGYADRTGPATGTLDTLEVTALALRTGNDALYLVGADVIAVDTALRAEIAARSGLSATDIMLCASHTHSGPLGIPNRLHPASSDTVDQHLRQQFIDTVADAITQAQSLAMYSQLAVGTVRLSGAWSNRNDPAATTDERVRFLTVRNRNAQLQTLVMLVPCHPTVLGSWNREVSADLHGSIRRALRHHLGEDIPVLTLTGAAGDISTRFTRRASSLAESDRLGALVADAVVAGIPLATPVAPGLIRSQASVTLPVRDVLPAAAETAYRQAQSAWRSAMQASRDTEADRRVAFTRLQGADIQRRMAGMTATTIDLEAWTLGDDFGMVGIPGEPFSALGREIEAAAGSLPTWVVGYANGYAGYLADAAAHRSGTYEALASPWSEGASDALVAGARLLLAGLKSPS